MVHKSVCVCVFFTVHAGAAVTSSTFTLLLNSFAYASLLSSVRTGLFLFCRKAQIILYAFFFLSNILCLHFSEAEKVTLKEKR